MQYIFINVKKATMKPQLQGLGDLSFIPRFVKHLRFNQQAVTSASAASENKCICVCTYPRTLTYLTKCMYIDIIVQGRV